MTPATRAAREALEAALVQAERHLDELAHGRKFRMCIPAQETDSDIVFANLIREARAALSLLAAPGQGLRLFGQEPQGCPTPGACSCPAAPAPEPEERVPHPIRDGMDAKLRPIEAMRECLEERGGYLCTLPRGHAGMHKAYGAEPEPYETWPAAPAQKREADGPIRTPPMCETHPLHSEPCPICEVSPVPPAGAPDPERGECGGFRVTADLLAPALRPEPGADLLARVRERLEHDYPLLTMELDREGLSARTQDVRPLYRDVLAALQARERGDG